MPKCASSETLNTICTCLPHDQGHYINDQVNKSKMSRDRHTKKYKEEDEDQMLTGLNKTP